jgi:hypothetical protein
MPDAGLDHCPRASTIRIWRMSGKNSKVLSWQQVCPNISASILNPGNEAPFTDGIYISYYKNPNRQCHKFKMQGSN